MVSANNNTNHNNCNSASKRFGAFGGVFTPNVLTILGVILFLRAGWVVGNAGLFGAVLIIVISHLISLSTGLSLSAIATSMDVKAGGNYYMISRTLGLEIGGSIGIPLYLSQALSIAFYIIGFTEGLRWAFPQLDPIFAASLTCVILCSVGIIGADWAIKVQYFILAVLGLSLISFFSGWTGSPHHIVFWQQNDVSFWMVFAVFFPAVTGIEVGVSMSGDLKRPEKSIPQGTLWAIGITFLVYLLQAGWLAWNVPGRELANNLMSMKSVSRWPFLVTAGLWAATLSSALGCIMAAPRTLQALARDGILPNSLEKGSKKTNEPRLATFVTFLIAESCILMGGLDVVAPVITMFFLNTYAVINLVAALESLAGNPSYRPTFKTPWIVSLSGTVGCYLAMFLINVPATVIALLITLGLFIYLSRKDFHVIWGDVRSGLWYSLARFAIFRLEDFEPHPLNWRPNIMVFSGNPNTRSQMIELANWLGKGKGMTSIHQLILGDENRLVQHRENAQKLLRNFIRENELHALGHVQLAANFREGVKQVVQAHGLGRFQSNLVMLGWCGESSREVEFAELIRELNELKKSVLALNIPDKNNCFGEHKRIDVWWSGMQYNGKLMLLIAHLIGKNPEWECCRVKLNMIIKDEQGRQAAHANMESLLQEIHIKAQVNIIVPESSEIKIPFLMRKYSQDSDLVILGMNLPETGKESEFMERMSFFLTGLPPALLVKSVENIELTT